jgi:hypothetical protein
MYNPWFEQSVMLIASPLALLGALLGMTEQNQAEDQIPMNSIEISPKLNTRHA